jgi:hypothetical protein
MVVSGKGKRNHPQKGTESIQKREFQFVSGLFRKGEKSVSKW